MEPIRTETTNRHELHPTAPRWTHIALHVDDIDASIAWYAEFTPLELLARRESDDGYGAWLGHPDQADRPFVLVLAQFLPDRDPFRDAGKAVLRPFAHLGIELPSQRDVDDAAARADAADCLAMAPKRMPDPIGYICMVSDPDGNQIEFSFDQGVYETAIDVWGGRTT